MGFFDAIADIISTGVDVVVGATVGWVVSGFNPVGALVGAGIGLGGSLAGYGATDIMADLFMPDITVDSSTYKGNQPVYTVEEGKPIARPYGRCRIAGNVIRSNDPGETTIKAIIGHGQGKIDGLLSWKINNIEWDSLTSVAWWNADYAGSIHWKNTLLGTDSQSPIQVNGANLFSLNPCAYRGVAHTGFNLEKNNQIGSLGSILVEGRFGICSPLGKLLCTSSFKWTVSGEEFYLELAAGGNPNVHGNSDAVLEIDGSIAVKGTIGVLAAGEWGYGDGDSLGYNTIYVRLSDGTDPDTKANDYIIIEEPKAFSRNPAVVMWDFYRNVENYAMRDLDCDDAFKALEVLCHTYPSSGDGGPIRPPGPNTTTVKTTTYFNNNYGGFQSFNVDSSIDGTWELNQWLSQNGINTNQRVNVDLGVPIVLTKIVLVNSHHGGILPTTGIQNFIIQGTNSKTAFEDTTYTAAGWTDVQTGLTATQYDSADPYKTYEVSSPGTAYRYYSIKIANGHGGGYIGFRDCCFWGRSPRYTFDYNFDSKININDAKKLIWQSFNGRVIRSQGKLKPVWDWSTMADGSGGLTAKTSRYSFTMDNIVTDSFTWHPRKRANKITIEYLDSSEKWKKTPVTEKDDSDIDDRGIIELKSTAYYITQQDVAARRCRRQLYRAMYADSQCKFTGFPSSQKLEVYDLVEVTHTLPGWTGKEAIVLSKSEDEYGRPTFLLEAYYAGVCDDVETPIPQSYFSTLPNPKIPPLSCTSISAILVAPGTNHDFDAVKVAFTAPNDPFYSYTEIYASKDDSTYYYAGESSGTDFVINGMGTLYEPGDTCYIKLKNVNSSGVAELMPDTYDDSIAITGSIKLANFYAGLNDFWGGNAAIGNVATTIVLGNLDGTSKIALGSTADAIVVAGTAPGFIADGTGKVYFGDGENKFVKFNGTTIIWKAANTELDASGNLIATSATLTGAITANTGKIGGADGWVISAGYLKDVAGVVGLSAVVTAGDDIRFWAGHATPGSAPFRVTEAGTLVATDATISGAITAGTIDIGGDDTTSFHVDATGGIWLGASIADKATAPFRVSNVGAAVCSTITITGGTVAGLTSDAAEGLYAGSGATRVQMKPGVGIWTGATLVADSKNYLNVDGSGKLASNNISWDTSGNITIAGSFTSTATITGGTIQTAASGARSVLNASGLAIYDATTQRAKIGSDGAGWLAASDKIAWTSAGVLTAGGWAISSSALTGTDAILKSAGVLSLGTGTDTYLTDNRIYIDGSNNKMSIGATFKVENGVITATSGTIGGFTLSASALYAGAEATRIQLDTTSGIHLGATAFADAPLKISLAGAITAISGAIGGWTLAATTLTSANITLDQANDKITVDTITIDGANNRIRSSNYVSGYAGTGFTLEPDLLEVGNIAARGIIRTAVFQKDVISCIGGNLFVRPADVLSTDMTAADASTLIIEGTETFAVNDILRIKDGTDDEWLLVTNIASAPTYTVTRDQAADYAADANPIWKKGASIVNYGASGKGGIYLTSSETNAPYMSMFTHAGAPWTTITSHLRLGNLNGSYGYSSELYGLGIGQYGTASKAWVTVEQTNGIRIGNNVTTKIKLGTDGSGWLAGDGKLNWDASGNITMTGSITLSNQISSGDVSDVGANADNTSGAAQACSWLTDAGDLATLNTVGVTQIDNGSITLIKCATATTNQMFSDATKATNIQAWIKSGDVTKIDGGMVATNTLIADSIVVGNWLSLPSDEHLVGYWAFDDGSGTVAVDGSGNGNNGTLVNMEDADWVDGVVGKCLSFDGVNEYVEIPSLGSFTEITVQAWLKQSAGVSTQKRPIIHDKTAPHISLRYNQDNVKNRLRVYVAFTTSSAEVITDSYDLESLHHITITVVQSTRIVNLYIDGEFVGTDTGVGNFEIANGVRNVIGANRHLNENFPGLCDEVRIYNTALTASEIKALYLYPAGNKGTRISGNQITTGKIQSNNWAAAAGMQIDLDNATMTIREADGLQVDCASGIKVLAGGDITLIGSDSAPGKIVFDSTYATYFGANITGSYIGLWPSTGNQNSFFLGYNLIDSVDQYFEWIGFKAKTSSYFQASRGSYHTGMCTTYAISTQAYADISSNFGGSAAKLARVRVYSDADESYLSVHTANTERFKIDINGLATFAGNLLVNGGNIGITADTDLIQLAANALTVNGSITCTNDVLLSNGNYIGISAAERLEFYTAGYAAFQGCNLVVGDTSSTYKVRVKSTGSDLFQLESTNGIATGIVQAFYHNSASPANNDIIVSTKYYGENNNSAKIEYWREEIVVSDVSNTSEDSRLKWYGQNGGVWNLAYYFIGSGIAYADASWNTFSPNILKHPNYKNKKILMPDDYLTWALEDAKKPVKPYKGIPKERTERDKYSKDACKIAIGTAMWAEDANERIKQLEQEIKMLKAA